MVKMTVTSHTVYIDNVRRIHHKFCTLSVCDSRLFSDRIYTFVMTFTIIIIIIADEILRTFFFSRIVLCYNEISNRLLKEATRQFALNILSVFRCRNAVCSALTPRILSVA